MSTPDIKLGKSLLLVCGVCCIAITAAYFVFLYGSWLQFQSDRGRRDSKIDELLDRISTRDTSASSPPAPAHGEVLRVRTADDKPPRDADTV
jgi:hypothetical protein